MTINSQVHVPTAHASRYLQQLCKHWSHNLVVDFDQAHGTVTFPRKARGADWPGDATLKLQARVRAGSSRHSRAPCPAISIASPSARHRSPSTGRTRRSPRLV